MRFILFITCFIMLSCQEKKAKTMFQTGDLLFICGGESDLSKAISRATEEGEALDFYHVGLVEVNESGSWLIHAHSERGVVRESIDSVLFDNPCYRFARISSEKKIDYTQVIAEAKSYLGRTYDLAYLPDNESIYCSELIYKAFLKEGIFDLEPMSFSDPDTGEILSTWVSYYEEMSIPVPEGELGCNPNQMANHYLIRFIQ